MARAFRRNELHAGRRYPGALLVLLGLLFSLPLNAGPPPPPPPALHFSTAPPPPITGVVAAEVPTPAGSPGLARKFYYFEDTAGDLTFADVRKPSFQDRFRLSARDNLNLGFTDSALWLRIDLRYMVDYKGPAWMLAFDYPLLDHIDVYDAGSPRDDPLTRMGDRLPFGARPVPHRSFALPIPAEGPDLRRLYVRVATQSSMQVRPALVSGRALFLSSNREELAFGVVYGLMVLMALYNLFLYFGLRDRSYLFFVGSTLCALMFLMSLYGHAFQYLWPGWPAFANLANPLLVSLWVVTTAAFARLFLESNRHSRATTLVLNGLMAAGAVSTTVALLASYRLAMELASALATVNAIALLVCGAIVWKSGERSARFFTLAWLALGFGVLGLAASRFGLVPDNLFTRHGALLASIVEIVLLSLALTDKYRLMHLALEGYSRSLEEKVADRTRQLEEANADLHRLSLTDPLTGVPNRRHFDEKLDAEFGRHRRLSAPLSLAMVDVDHFKEFNDRHGHPVGDECLRAVAEALSAVAHRSADVVARYGGEEFAVLLPETDADGARRTGERMLEVVRALRLSSGEHEASQVTVSVGLTTRVPDGTEGSESLVAEADEALYQAKRNGRDRVFVTNVIAVGRVREVG